PIPSSSPKSKPSASTMAMVPQCFWKQTWKQAPSLSSASAPAKCLQHSKTTNPPPASPPKSCSNSGAPSRQTIRSQPTTARAKPYPSTESNSKSAPAQSQPTSLKLPNPSTSTSSHPNPPPYSSTETSTTSTSCRPTVPHG